MNDGGRVADAAMGVPAFPLRPFVTRYSGYRYLGWPPGLHRGLPSRSLTVVLALDAPTHMTAMPDPRQPSGEFQALASGLHAGPVGIGHDGDQFGVQLDLTPAGSRALLGLPAGELAGVVVDLADLLGWDSVELIERMRATPTWSQRFAVLDEVLLRRATIGSTRIGSEGPGSPLRRAWQCLTDSGGSVRIGDVADEVGWSRRHLAERFRQEFGLTPKEFARVVRFERSKRALLRGTPTLADVAADCGYYDQAHLAREWGALAGCAPSVWLASEDLPSVQDAVADPRHASVS